MWRKTDNMKMSKKSAKKVTEWLCDRTFYISFEDEMRKKIASVMVIPDTL